MAALFAFVFSLAVLALCLASSAMMVGHLRRLEADAPPPAIVPLDGGAVQRGATLFAATCAACHGSGGEGKPNLGKDLQDSWFVASSKDGAMIAFIKAGRATSDPRNTTKVPMPPKGNNPDLTDAQIGDIVTFVRALQDPRGAPEGSMIAKVEPPRPRAVAAKQPDGSADSDADDMAEAIASGKALFMASCTACHGRDGKGLPKLGKNLVASTFAAGLKDEELAAFVKRGRDMGDPLNTTKLAMPPKGGNPALDDDQLADIAAFVHSIQKESAGH